MGNFFAPETRCSSPSFADLFVVRGFGDLLPMLAQKLAERSLSHGRMYRRIFCASIFLRVFQLWIPPEQIKLLFTNCAMIILITAARLSNLPNVVISSASYGDSTEIVEF